MERNDLDTLISYLRRGTPRTRVGLWLASLNEIGHEEEIAIRLGIEPSNFAQVFLKRLPQGAQFARLSPQKIIEVLDAISSSAGTSDCVLVFNFDLLLAGLKVQERQFVWSDLYNHFPNRRRALIIMMPKTAYQLLPNEILIENWQREKRIVQ